MSKRRARKAVPDDHVSEDQCRGPGKDSLSHDSAVAVAGPQPAQQLADEDAPKEAAAASRRSSRHKERVDYSWAADEGGDDQDNSSSSSSDEEEEEAPSKKKRKKQQGKNSKPKKGPRIGRWKARKIYCLDDNDLAQMKDVTETYSYFAGHNTMYSSRELEEYARKKHAGSKESQSTLEASLQADKARRERKRGRRDTATAAALQTVTQYGVRGTALEVEQYGDTALPDSVLVRVMQCLAKTREPGGLRGFACVAQDLANASLANWDFHRAAKEGFAALAEEAQTSDPPVPRTLPRAYAAMSVYRDNRSTSSFSLLHLPGNPSLGGWEFWEAFLRDPLSHKVAKLKEAMWAVGLQPKGNKAELAVCLLGAFGLEAATSTPVQLLRVVRLERSKCQAWDGPDSSSLHARVNTAIDQLLSSDWTTWMDLARAKERGVASIRAVIRSHFDSIDEFVQAGAKANQEKLRQAAEAAAAAAAAATAAAAAAEAAADASGPPAGDAAQPANHTAIAAGADPSVV